MEIIAQANHIQLLRPSGVGAGKKAQRQQCKENVKPKEEVIQITADVVAGAASESEG
jgi:hypothetical protein